MGQPHIRRQVLKSTKEKPQDIDLEYKIRKMQCFVKLWTLVQQRKEYFTQVYADASPPHQEEEKNTFTPCVYIIVMP